ncbi:ankyrin containing protein [Acanthamoeba polyphaga mimivirus]|uniref:Putative ankyrin repeat protein L92 n=1 Tax=Acanthamoeba polyphaga mimivirus TaxID=212035 RepID=YL092_MIMIV|nr:RecName: Full=Putative ankyrin repeat protein L92 [Acanthamoeba polyphaga mimivirus]AAV50367.1 ankyrin containing protein [Acanthamoeba polyphaga mimivirus]
MCACKFATYNSNIGAVKLLLDKGADINCMRKDGMSALSAVCKNLDLEFRSDFDTIKLLIERGADVNLTVDGHYTPLMWLIKNLSENDDRFSESKISSIKNLFESDDDDYFFENKRKNKYNALKLLLDNGANIEAKCDGETPLLLACKLSSEITSTKHIKILLKKGAKTNIESNDRKTPLMLLCKNCQQYLENEAVDVLIKYGKANINYQNSIGETALIYLCRISFMSESVQFLLEKGANPNIQDNSGNTALHYAVKRHEFEMVEILLRYNASPEIINKKGKNVFSNMHKISIGVVEQLCRYNINIQLSAAQKYSILQTPSFVNGVKLIGLIESNTKIKTIMDFTINVIPKKVLKIIYHENSLKMKLVKMAWLCRNYSIDKIITMENFWLFDYLNVETIDQLKYKITELTKYES